jgi:hypothetical protein
MKARRSAPAIAFATFFFASSGLSACALAVDFDKFSSGSPTDGATDGGPNGPPGDAGVEPTATAIWDGTSPFTCGGVDHIVLKDTVATAGVTVTIACNLTLIRVSITAPIGISASGIGVVNMTGGSITSSTNSVVATTQAQVHLVGTKVTGPTQSSQLAQVTIAP